MKPKPNTLSITDPMMTTMAMNVPSVDPSGRVNNITTLIRKIQYRARSQCSSSVNHR